MKRYLPFIIIALVLAAAVAGFSMLWKSNRGGEAGSSPLSTGQPPPVNNSSTSSQSPAALPGATRPNVKVSSPVVIEEYGDYQCPPCGQLYPELKQIEAEYRDQVRLVFHHFPLAKLHKNAMAAARAAEAARNQNKFWEMHDRLYVNQKAWAEVEDPLPTFLSYARDLKLDVGRFQSDLSSNEVDQRILADMQKGAAAGVTGTPTVFLDGNLLRYEATTADGMRRGINLLLMRKAGS
jgi:protein-disulfide isomerase